MKFNLEPQYPSYLNLQYTKHPYTWMALQKTIPEINAPFNNTKELESP